MSDCERIAQVQKWENERIARFFEQIAHLQIIRSFFLQKTSDSLSRLMSEFPTLSSYTNVYEFPSISVVLWLISYNNG